MKKIAYALLAIGATLIVISIGLTSYTSVKYNKLISDFETNTNNVSELENLKQSMDIKKENIKEDMIGIIEIPSIKVKYPILEGTDDAVLRKAVGHFITSALPGEGSNMALIGHNNFILAEPFKNLSNLQNGAEVIIKTIDNTYTYQVTKRYTVNPYNMDIVKESKETKLTLVTCTDDAEKRLVVEAILSPKQDIHAQNNVQEQ